MFVNGVSVLTSTFLGGTYVDAFAAGAFCIAAICWAVMVLGLTEVKPLGGRAKAVGVLGAAVVGRTKFLVMPLVMF